MLLHAHVSEPGLGRRAATLLLLLLTMKHRLGNGYEANAHGTSRASYPVKVSAPASEGLSHLVEVGRPPVRSEGQHSRAFGSCGRKYIEPSQHSALFWCLYPLHHQQQHHVKPPQTYVCASSRPSSPRTRAPLLSRFWRRVSSTRLCRLSLKACPASSRLSWAAFCKTRLRYSLLPQRRPPQLLVLHLHPLAGLGAGGRSLLAGFARRHFFLHFLFRRLFFEGVTFHLEEEGQRGRR